MAVTAWFTPATLGNEPGVAGTYANPSNALTANSVYATQTDTTQGTALLSGPIPAGCIPVGATLTGVEIFVKGKVVSPGGFSYYPSAYIFNSTGLLTATKVSGVGYDVGSTASTTPLTSVDTTTIGGGPTTMPSDMYGGTASFSVDEYNSGALTVGFFVSGLSSSSNDTISIDHVGIRFTYTGGAAQGPVTYTNTGTGTQSYGVAYAGITTTAVTFPTAGASSGGTVGSWVNPNNIVASDNVRATMTFTGSSGTTIAAWPFLTSSGYGFNIPSNATIMGISVGVEAVQSGGTTGAVRFQNVGLVKVGTTTTNKATTTSIATTESVIPYGGSSDLWGTSWTPAEVNASTFGVIVRPIGTTATTNRVMNVDAITVQVTYVVPPAAAGDPVFIYTNTGSGTQSFVGQYDAFEGYTNTGTGSQAYSVTTISSVSFAYTNTGAGSQAYAPRFDDFESYTNSGASTQAYAPKFSSSTKYTNSGSGTQAFALRFNDYEGYTNTGTGTQTYTIALAGAGYSYINTGAGSQAYAPKFTSTSSFANSDVGSQAYAPKFVVTSRYTNTGTGTQTYQLTAPAQPVTNFGDVVRGRSIHAPVEPPKPTRQEKKKAKKAAAKAARVVDQAAVDALKAGLQVQPQVDPEMQALIEAARLQMEQELAARLEEEELQMVVVMALAHHRRSRLRFRLAA